MNYVAPPYRSYHEGTDEKGRWWEMHAVADMGEGVRGRLYCPGCAEGLGVKFGFYGKLAGFEAHCPRCEVDLYRETALVVDGPGTPTAKQMKEHVTAWWRYRLELDDFGFPEGDFYKVKFEGYAEAFGWGDVGLDRDYSELRLEAMKRAFDDYYEVSR